MNVRSTVAVGALTIAAMTIGLGTANAAPAAPVPPALDYSVQLADAAHPGAAETVVTRLQHGTFALSKTEVAAKPGAPATPVDTIDVKDSSGRTVLTLPLAFNIAGIQVQAKPVLKNAGKELDLTPNRTVKSDKPVQVRPVQVVQQNGRPVAQDVALPIENQRSFDNFTTKLGMANGIGEFLGAAAGVVVGGIAGCIVGLPVLLYGCIPGAIAGAAAGGLIGTVLGGGPTLTLAGQNLITTLMAQPGSTQWTDENAHH